MKLPMTLFQPVYPIFISMLKEIWLFPLTSFEIVNSIQSVHSKLDLPVTRVPKASLHYIPKSSVTPPPPTPSEAAITRKEGHDKKQNNAFLCRQQLFHYIAK